MFNKNYNGHSEEWIDELIQKATEAVQAYEDYLLDRIDHNKLAKVMKRLYNSLPAPQEKAKKIENRNPKDFFQ